MDAFGSTIALSRLNPEQNRKVWIKNKKGDAVGSGFLIPKADFAHFLGWKKATKEEESGKKPIDAWRTLELAIQKEMDTVGKSAVQNGERYRNLFIAPSKYENAPGREKEMLNEGVDSIQQSVEMGHATSMKYMELQYKFLLASKNFSVISNLMKVRHEAMKKSVSEIR